MSNKKKVDFAKLEPAITWSQKQMKTPRENRVQSIKAFVGHRYNDDGSPLANPVNFLELAITIYNRLLAANSPRVLFTAKNRSLKPFAKTTEIALNQIPDEIDLGGILSDCVKEALFLFSVVKVGLAHTGEMKDGVALSEPYVTGISPDDYFCDMNAKNRKTMQFEGNTYWMNIDDAKAFYKNQELQADDYTTLGEEGEERAEEISKSESTEVFKDQIHLADVWLPRTRQILTYTLKDKKVIKTTDFDGPEHGPYHMLGYSTVPDNVLPLAPVANWHSLNELANNLFRKLSKQAIAFKKVIAFQSPSDDAINAYKNASDGEGIRYAATKPEMLTTGGADAALQAFFLQVTDQVNYFMGNLDALGGLAPSTDTVGQDKLISEAASARLQSMRESTLEFAEDIFRSLAWYEWTDPIRERKVFRGIPGTDFGVEVPWSYETREADFLDFNFNIDVYSMQSDTPEIKIQKISTIFERFIIPLLPIIQAQGGEIDIEGFLTLIADYSNIGELKDLVSFNGEGLPQQPVQGSPLEGAVKPPNTTHTNVRVNRPGATQRGKSDAMQRLLSGSGIQDAEAAAIGKGNS